MTHAGLGQRKHRLAASWLNIISYVFTRLNNNICLYVYVYCMFAYTLVYSFLFAVFSLSALVWPSHPTLISQRTISQWANSFDSRQNREKELRGSCHSKNGYGDVSVSVAASLSHSCAKSGGIWRIFETTLFVVYSFSFKSTDLCKLSPTRGRSALS